MLRTGFLVQRIRKINWKNPNIFRYTQLVEKDIIKFGLSTREYIMLHDRSHEEQEKDTGLDW